MSEETKRLEAIRDVPVPQRGRIAQLPQVRHPGEPLLGATMNATLADTITIRHECECQGATKPPGEQGPQHLFEIDGVEFPWYITQQGPLVHLNEHGLYEVHVVILAEHVIM